jgi:poly(beta-D-mannuronate) lyase
MRLWLFAAVAVAFLGVMPAVAEETRVRTADDFHRTIKSARPGDRIVLANGPWRDVELVADAAGSIQAPITVQAETPGQVVISGNSRLRIAGSHVVVRGLRFQNAWHKTALVEFRHDSKRLAADCRLTDCEIADCHPPDPKSEFKYLSIYGRHNVVDHCRLQGKTNGGTTLVVWLGGDGGGGHHEIRLNHFGPRPELGRNGGETIRIGDSKTAHLSGNTIVEANLFEECNGETEVISNKSCDNIYRRNMFLRCSGTLTLRHGHRCRVEQNVFHGHKARGSGGVRIIGSDHVVINNRFERLEGDDYRSALCMMNGIPDSPASGYQPVERALVAHNTFFDCKRTILIGADNDHQDQVAPSDCLIANNLLISRRGPIVDVQTSPREISWLGNLCFGDGELGVDPGRGIQRLTRHPLRHADDHWTLYAESPAVDAAVKFLRIPKQDFHGRGRDDRPDVGCDEWSAKMPSQSAVIDAGPSF